MEDLTGRQFGAYQVIAPLGEGGMAAVYKAYQPAMERYVAVKVLPRHMAASEEFVARFRREARLLAQLQHPHILPVFDYGESDGYFYIVMPFVQSGTLAELLTKRTPSLAETRRIMIQIGDALSYAHARGMIHRDIKPSNVLIDERGNCLLTDFGLARMVEATSKLTSSGTVMGTPAYMSPEQGAGSPLDQRSDIYSLGIILYEMVTGRVPYVAETPIAVVFKHIQDPLPSARTLNPSLPEAVELVLMKSLAKSPDDRYQTAEEFVRAIQKAIPEDGVFEQQDSPLLPEVSVAEAAHTIQSQPVSVKNQEKGSPINSSKPNRVWILACSGIGLLGLVVVVASIAIFSLTSKNSLPVSVTSTFAVFETSAPLVAPTNSPVPTVSPTTVAPSVVAPGAEFRDEFDGELSDGWRWLEEDPSKWSLSAVNGSLQILASDASFDGPSTPLNILLRDAPSRNFEITTSLRFTPTSNYQFAGLVIFQDPKNVLQFGHAFCDVVNACVGEGIYFDDFENGSDSGTNYATRFQGKLVYLRLQRIGNTYTASYSEDGKNWIVTGEHSRDWTQVQVGLVAAQAPTKIPALFDYFTLNSLQP